MIAEVASIIEQQKQIMGLMDDIKQLRDSAKEENEGPKFKIEADPHSVEYLKQRREQLIEEHQRTIDFMEKVNQLAALREDTKFKYDKLMLEDMIAELEGQPTKLNTMQKIMMKMSFEVIFNYDESLANANADSRSLKEMREFVEQMQDYFESKSSYEQ